MAEERDMSSGEQKAGGKRPLGPPSVRMVPPDDAARAFAAGRSLPAREPAPDETGKIVGAGRQAH
jgi:hypothetical protein